MINFNILKNAFCIYFTANAVLYFKVTASPKSSSVTELPNETRESGYFWQLTDIHWDFNYSTSGIWNEMCHQSIKPSETTDGVGYYGNYYCDAPWSLVLSTFQAMKTFCDKPDFILWTGDNAPHTGDMAPFPIIFEALKNLTNELKQMFGADVPIIPVLGNHDTYPKDDFPDTDEAFYAQFLQKGSWEEIIPIDAITDFKRGGYFIYKLSPKLSIMVLNTNIYYNINAVRYKSEDPDGQFEWMKKHFQELRNAGGKALVAAHSPPGYWERSPKIPFLNATLNDQYVDILNEFGDVILAQLYGHLHTDSFRIFGTTFDNLKSVAFLAPSVTPFYPTRQIGATAVNPSIRLYTYNNSVILDYVQYNMNLTEANNATRDYHICSTLRNENGTNDCSADSQSYEPWKEYYRATKLFGVDSLSVEGLTDAYNKLYSNDSLFQQYFIMNSAGYDQNHCNTTCKRDYLCAISHLKFGSVPECINRASSNSSNTSHISKLTPYEPRLRFSDPSSAEDYLFSHSFMTATVALTTAVSAIVVIIGVMLIVSSVRRKRILRAGSKLPEFEWVNRHNGYRPLNVDAD